MPDNTRLLELQAKLKGSFMLFSQFFYKIVENKDFIIGQPLGRESHFITVARALTRCSRLECNRLILNLPPGYGKSTMVNMWVAWTLSQYPDSRYIIISYNKDQAMKNTAYIKTVISTQEYKEIFGIYLKQDARSKSLFETINGGVIAAFGSNSGVTGKDAGYPGLSRFSGAVIMDDLIKPDDAHSDTIRTGVIRNYNETIKQRPRNTINVPLICIGQRIHEEDLPAFLLQQCAPPLERGDGHHWERVIMPGLDEHDQALYPDKESAEYLKIEREVNAYVFAAQYQQNPQPAGGSLFKKEWFVLLKEEPKMLCTFIVVDTAETDKTYNDATVFSFFGYYKIEDSLTETAHYGLHWINCREFRTEPHNLEEEFLDFWSDCMRYPVQPYMAAIEKKSTGVTLVSVLKNKLRGIMVKEIERTSASGSKTQRFINGVPFVSKRLVSLPENGRHTEKCITHMAKITANNSHANDDVADTLMDGLQMAFIKKNLYYTNNENNNKVTENITAAISERKAILNRAYYGRGINERK